MSGDKTAFERADELLDGVLSEVKEGVEAPLEDLLKLAAESETSVLQVYERANELRTAAYWFLHGAKRLEQIAASMKLEDVG